jgi:hypothetical protein
MAQVDEHVLVCNYDFSSLFPRTNASVSTPPRTLYGFLDRREREGEEGG